VDDGVLNQLFNCAPGLGGDGIEGLNLTVGQFKGALARLVQTGRSQSWTENDLAPNARASKANHEQFDCFWGFRVSKSVKNLPFYAFIQVCHASS
jgi:hypothetical protein